MKKKLTSQQQSEEQQSAAGQLQARTESAREFASVEEMLRHDALHTPVPPAVAHRLQASIRQSPNRSWWQRLFGP